MRFGSEVNPKKKQVSTPLVVLLEGNIETYIEHNNNLRHLCTTLFRKGSFKKKALLLETVGIYSKYKGQCLYK